MEASTIIPISNLKLSSNNIQEGKKIRRAQVYDNRNCKGHNLSPYLSWSGAPESTKSFAITVFDPDAPRPSGWWHWVVFNIPKDIQELPAGIGVYSNAKLPAHAIEIMNDYGEYGYGGPCPPKGDKPHHYQFSIYALDIDVLQLDSTATASEVKYLLEQHKLAIDTISAYYNH
ncbi:MAG: kinase inhibitor [Rickettsiaceae bacterium]|jgi:Raf kinase inhibitor-like YbhB/YbcL family protein|nr:kinase inhibitor [Rickettsiaceae bacterium]